MRTNILMKVTSSLPCKLDYQQLASQTDGFSGSDLRMLVKEAILSSLMDNRKTIGNEDIEKGIHMVKNRDAIRRLNWL
jgi:ATP-dependent 26S proteasome regulatory subunit